MFSAELLLNPIRADLPAGEDLTFAPELDAINQARKFDDPSLDQGEWVTDLKEADWDFVTRRCAVIIEQKSKDLRLAVWLTEAAAQQHGLRGLAEGFRVIAGLIDQYWDRGLYPESDGDDHDQRVGNLSWILARTPALLRAMPVTDGNGSAYSMIDFETARKSPNGPGPKLADLESARSQNSARFRASFATDAQYCLDALLAFEKAADERLGGDSPGFASARDAVGTMLSLMPPVAAAQQEPAGEAASGGTAPADGTPLHAAAVPSGPPGAIVTRTQAIAQLRAVAEFFRRTEPHSPVSYFAEKAAAAGEQDLHTWLRSVVKDQTSLAHIEELLGVKPQD